MSLIKSYRPEYDDPVWTAARDALALSQTRIAQIDTGLFAHAALGFGSDGTAPANIAIAEGRNVFDPDSSPFGSRPLTDLRKSTGTIGNLIDNPDHGVKTLGVILSDADAFAGVAQGAKVVPYRAANGPVFRRTQADLGANTHAMARVGAVIEHTLALAIPPRVITMSMGNPGLVPWEFLRLLLGGSIGVPKSLSKSIDRAYLRGIPVVCAAGQIELSVLFPAVMKRTIAVAGFEHGVGAQLIHYPHGGYNNQDRVDTYALAVGLNRPGGHLAADGASIVQTFAEDEVPASKPEGTSYATPFVAAAFAMWFTKHQATLTAPEFSGRNAWRRVEAFRKILHAMPVVMADAGHQGKPDIAIRPLRMVSLLQTPPSLAGLEKQPPFRNLTFSNTDTDADYGDPLIG